MAEQILFDKAGVKVSNARFVAGAYTYAVAAITSVRFTRNPPNRALPTILWGVGGFLLLGAVESGGEAGAGVTALAASVVVIVCGGLGALAWFGMRSSYSVRIRTAGGESDAFKAKDRQLVSEVVQALNDAIVARG